MAGEDGTKGDLLVTVEVLVPQKLDDKARAALEEFRDATAGDDPRAELHRTGQRRVAMEANYFDLSDDTPVYVISVAAQLSGLHPQTLRQYDRLGLVSPGRTAGRGRLYSTRDIVLLREVQRLSQEEGINLAGIKRILDPAGRGRGAARASGRDRAALPRWR